MRNELRGTTNYTSLEKYAYLQDVYICSEAIYLLFA